MVKISKKQAKDKIDQLESIEEFDEVELSNKKTKLTIVGTKKDNMALIDDEIFDKEEPAKKEKPICQDCKNEIDENSPILLCEQCFNARTKETLEKIKTNILEISNKLKMIDESIEKINKDLEIDNLHIVVRNKLEIDLLNLEAIKKKLLIDKELNYEAFVTNQHQANKIRKISNWILFDIIEFENM